MVGSPSRHRRFLPRFGTALLLIGALLAVSCGGDDSGSASASATSVAGGGSTDTTALSRESLKVGVAVVSVNFAPLFVAKDQGFFDKEGLDVSVENLAANVVNGVVSGRVDLGVVGPGSALIPVKDGKDTKIIYNHVGDGLVILAARPGVNSPGDCQRVATLSPGSSLYGWAVLYKSGFDASYDIVPMGDLPAMNAAALSGNVDCLTTTVPLMQKPLKEGTLHVLADPRKPDTLPKSGVIPTTLHEGAIWGLTDNLQAKKEAVIRFTRAMDDAIAWIKANDDLTVAKLLRKENDIALTGDDQFVATTVAENRYSFAPHGGVIDEADWNAVLSFLQGSGLTFIDPNDPKWQFAARVDMSYLDAGRARG